MKWFKYFLIILIIVTFIPIIEIEEVNEINGTTLIDYRSLGSYVLEYLEKMYLQNKEKTSVKRNIESGDENQDRQAGQD